MTAHGPGAERSARIAMWATAAFVAIIAVLLLLALERVVDGKINDFYGYWNAARATIEGRGDGAPGAVWLPALTYCIVPLGLMPLLVSAAVWTVANAALVAALCHMAATAAVRAARAEADAAAVPVVRLLTLAALLPPMRNVIYEGQFDLLSALLCTAAVSGIAAGRSAAPAAAAVAAAIVKWASLALLPWMAVRRPSSVAAALALAPIALLSPALIVGWDACMAQLRSALSGPVSASVPYVTMPDRWSLTNGLARIAESAGWSPRSGLFAAGCLCAALAAFLLVQYLRRGIRIIGMRDSSRARAPSPELLLAEGAAMLALPLAIHPHIATRHAVIGALAVALLARAAVLGSSRRAAIAGLAAVAVTWYLPYPMRAWWQWCGGPALAMLCAAALAVWIALPPALPRASAAELDSK